MECQSCGKELTGNQEKWCSEKCNAREWKKNNREHWNKYQREKYATNPKRKEYHRKYNKKRYQIEKAMWEQQTPEEQLKNMLALTKKIMQEE